MPPSFDRKKEFSFFVNSMPIILCIINFLSWVILTWYLLTNYHSLNFWVIFGVNILLIGCYHYFFNLLHITSHFAIKKPTLSRLINNLGELCRDFFKTGAGLVFYTINTKNKNISTIKIDQKHRESVTFGDSLGENTAQKSAITQSKKSDKEKPQTRGSSVWLNVLIGTFSATLGGMTFYSFQKTHLKHHQYYLKRELLEDSQVLKNLETKNLIQESNSSQEIDQSSSQIANQDNVQGKPGKPVLDQKIVDPDKKLLIYGPLVTPFLIFSHDFSFFALKPKNSEILNYAFTRFVQTVLLVWLFSNYPPEAVLGTVFLPLLVVGYLNSFFLFYFPHYSPKWETTLRQKLGKEFGYKK